MIGRTSGIGSRVVAGICGALLLLSLTLVAGCGKGETNLKATVTYNGQTVKNGAIDIDSKPGRGGNIDAEGKVFIKNVPAGKWKVKFIAVGDPKEIEPAGIVKDKKVQNFETSG